MHDDLPPKMVKAQLVRLDDSLKQIERRQVAGIQRAPGSLPVLEAFQAFLENERRQARQRMLAITAFAVLLLSAVAGAGFLLVQQQLRLAATELKEVGNRTEAIAATVDSLKSDKDAELLALENRFRDESDRIIAQYSSLQQEQQALVETISSSSLETLDERLLRLETENETLHARLVTLIADHATRPSPLPAETLQMEPRGIVDVKPTAPAPILDERDDLATTAVPAAGTRTVAIVEHPSVLLMTIVPVGHTSGIRWMLPRQFTRE